MPTLTIDKMHRDLKVHTIAYRKLSEMSGAFARRAEGFAVKYTDENFEFGDVTSDEGKVEFTFCSRTFRFMFTTPLTAVRADGTYMLLATVHFFEVEQDTKGAVSLKKILQFAIDVDGETDQKTSAGIACTLSNDESIDALILHCLYRAVFSD